MESLPAWFEQACETFPFLRTAPEAVRDTFVANARKLEVPAGQPMCFQGQRCEHLALLLDGQVRVYKVGEQGREVTLYRVRAGDSCILSAACILSERAFPAQAETETTVRAVTIPAPVFRQWAITFDVWREHVFGQLVRRLVDVIDVLEDVTFRRLDSRLATYLVAAAGDSEEAIRTHQAIAADLGTSREVISRLLKEWERRNAVALSRGRIRLLDRPFLAALGSDALPV